MMSRCLQRQIGEGAGEGGICSSVNPFQPSLSQFPRLSLLEVLLLLLPVLRNFFLLTYFTYYLFRCACVVTKKFGITLMSLTAQMEYFR